MLKYFPSFDVYLDADAPGGEEIICDDDCIKRDEDFDLSGGMSFDLAIERIAFDSENIWRNGDDGALRYMYNVLLQRHQILQERIETTTASDILAGIVIKNNDVPYQDNSDDISNFEALTLKSEIPNAPTYDYLTDGNVQVMNEEEIIVQLHSAYWDDVRIVGFGRNKTSPFPAYNDSFDPRLTFRGLFEDAFPTKCGFIPFAGCQEGYNVTLPVGRISDVVGDYFDKYDSLLNDLRTSPWDLYDDSLENGNEVIHDNDSSKTSSEQPWSELTSMPYISPNMTAFLCEEMDSEVDSETDLLKKRTCSDYVKNLWKTSDFMSFSSTDNEDEALHQCYDSPCQPEHGVAYSRDSDFNIYSVSDKREHEGQSVWPSQLYPFGHISNMMRPIAAGPTHDSREWLDSAESQLDSEWPSPEARYQDNWVCMPYNKGSDDRCLFQYDNQARHVEEPDSSKSSPESTETRLTSADVQETNSQYAYLANTPKYYMHPWHDQSKSITKSPPQDLNSPSVTDTDDGDCGQAIPVIISKSQHDHYKKRHTTKYAKTTVNKQAKEQTSEVKPRSSQLSPTCEPFIPNMSKRYTTDDNASNASFDYEQQRIKDHQKSEQYILESYQQHSGEQKMLESYEQPDISQTKYMNTYNNGYLKTESIDIVTSVPSSSTCLLDHSVDDCDSLNYSLSALPSHQPVQFELSNDRPTEPSFSSHMLQETHFSEDTKYGCFLSQLTPSKQNHVEERHDAEQRSQMSMHGQQKNHMRFSCGDESLVPHSDLSIQQQPTTTTTTTTAEAQFYKWQSIDMHSGTNQNSTMEKQQHQQQQQQQQKHQQQQQQHQQHQQQQQQPVTWHDTSGIRQNEYTVSNQTTANRTMQPRHVTCVTQPSFSNNVRKVIFLTKQHTAHLQPQQAILQTPQSHQTIPLQHHAIQTSQAMYHGQQNRIDTSGLSRPDPYQGSRLLPNTIHHIQPSQQTRVNPAAYPGSYRTYASVATKLVVNNHGPRYDQLASTRTIAMTAPKYTSNMVAIPTIDGYQPARYYGPLLNFNNHNAIDPCDMGESSKIAVDPVGEKPKEYEVCPSSRKEARPIRANPANLIRIK